MPLDLTESQKTCLRLVAQEMTSKEIAAQVGLSPSTVDTYLRLASTSLGVSNRREAARRFLAEQTLSSEGTQASQEESEHLRYQSPAVVVDLPPEEDAGASVMEGSSAPGQARLLDPMRPPPIGGIRNDLEARQRLVDVMRIALFLAAAMTGLVLFALGAIRVLR